MSIHGVWKKIVTTALKPNFPPLSSHALSPLGCVGDAVRDVLVCGGEGGPRVLNSADDSLFLFKGAEETVQRLPNEFGLLGHAVASANGELFLFAAAKAARWATDQTPTIC